MDLSVLQSRLHDTEELERCLRSGAKFVRLSDNSYAAMDPEQVQAMLDREVELLTTADKSGKLPLSQVGRVQELLQHASHATIAPSTRQLFKRISRPSSGEKYLLVPHPSLPTSHTGSEEVLYPRIKRLAINHGLIVGRHHLEHGRPQVLDHDRQQKKGNRQGR